MKLVKNWKLACASLLAVCCMGTAAAGFALAGKSTAAAAEAAATGWDGGGTKVGDVTLFTDSASIRSNIDILSLPGNTGVFYMYFSDAAEDSTSGWSGFTLRNGNDGIGCTWTLENADAATFPWHSLCFEDDDNHMIFQDNRVFTPGGTLGGLHGTEGENFSKGMTPVEIHIGEGQAQNDPSYIKIGGVEIKQEDSDTAITLPWTRAAGTSKELTASMFPKGCYVAIHYCAGSDVTHELALSDVGSISMTDANMNKTQTYQAGGFEEALTATLTSAADAFAGDTYTVTANVNGNELSADAVTVTKTNDKEAQVSIAADKLNAINKSYLKSSTYIAFHVTNGEEDYGSAVVGTNIVFEAPPVFAEGTDEITLTSKEPITYTFTYSGEYDPMEMAISYSHSAEQIALTKSTDFTVQKGADDSYTVTITQTGVDKIFSGYSTATITLSFGPHIFRSSAYISGQTTEYGIRFREGIDYVDNTLNIDKFYASAQLHVVAAAHSPHIFYENSIDVSEPIFLEYATLDSRVQWMFVSLMSSPKLAETVSNETGKDAGNIVSFIMFGNDRHNMQGMQGTFENGTAVPEFMQNTNMKNNVIEIKLGETNAADGYIKVNGEKIDAVLTRSQKDFPEGKAWVGLFFSTSVAFDFTINTYVNAVAITAPQNDSDYTMDLADAKDFTVTLANTSGDLTLTDENGTTISADDYAFAGGKLTVKASYFSKKSFSKNGQIFIWDNEKETGTAFKMTYTSSGMSEIKIAYAMQGALTDVVFDLGVTSVSGIQKDGTAISAENYSFADGKLTVKASALQDEKGMQEFLVTADGKLYPCYVCVDQWTDGFAFGTGAAKNGGTYTLSGKTSYTQAKTYDLTSQFSVGIEFTEIEEYYQRAANQNATRVAISFYDPFSKNTLTITVFANFADESITTANQALYIEYGLVAEDGTKLAGGDARPVAPKEGANSASGAHTLLLEEKNGGLTVTFAGRPFNLSSSALKGFNMKACVLSVSTEASTSGSAVQLTTGEASTTPGGEEQPGGGSTENPSDEEDEGGCGGTIAVGAGVAIAVACIALAATAVIVVRRKKNQ